MLIKILSLINKLSKTSQMSNKQLSNRQKQLLAQQPAAATGQITNQQHQGPQPHQPADSAPLIPMGTRFAAQNQNFELSAFDPANDPNNIIQSQDDHPM